MVVDIRSFLITFLFFAGIVVGQDATKIPPSIRTNGEAVEMATPDRARIDFGVMTQAKTSQTAVEQNAQKLAAVLASLRRLLGADADIKTISYTLSPNYLYPKEGGEPSITGYTATNVVSVTLDDLTQVGKAIDAATQAGANRIQSLQFTLRDERAVQARALRTAALNARSKADALASALNVRIVRVFSVVESSPIINPIHNVAYARADSGAATPIEPGTIEVRATVELMVEISPQ